MRKPPPPPSDDDRRKALAAALLAFLALGKRADRRVNAALQAVEASTTPARVADAAARRLEIGRAHV